MNINDFIKINRVIHAAFACGHENDFLRSHVYPLHGVCDFNIGASGFRLIWHEHGEGDSGMVAVGDHQG